MIPIVLGILTAVVLLGVAALVGDVVVYFSDRGRYYEKLY